MDRDFSFTTVRQQLFTATLSPIFSLRAHTFAPTVNSIDLLDCLISATPPVSSTRRVEQMVPAAGGKWIIITRTPRQVLVDPFISGVAGEFPEQFLNKINAQPAANAGAR